MSMELPMLSALLNTATPALPDAWLVRMYLPLGWAVVLAAMGLVLLARLSFKARCALAGGLVVWALVPGPLSPTYWLGLAFQAPSVASVLLGGWLVWRGLFSRAGAAKPEVPASVRWWLVLPAVLLGYALLLDTLALLPWHMVGWGFSGALLLALMAWTLMPWLLGGGHQDGAKAPLWIAPGALLLFAATRLPSGNVWDALMDPLLWLLLQGVLLRHLRRRYRSRRPASRN